MADNFSDFTDEELMTAVRMRNHHRAFEELVDRYGKNLLNFFVRSGVRNDAEDLVQQTFLRLYRYRERYVATAKFSTFIFLLARQVWIDSVRRKSRHEKNLQALDAELIEVVPADLKEPHQEHDAQHDVAKALECLSPALRQVVVLGAINGLSYAQIAEVLSIPEGTVKSRMFNALAKMREYLKKDEADERM